MAKDAHIPTLPSEGGRSIAFERIDRQEGEVRNSLHRHDYSEVFVFLSGTGTHMIDLHRHSIAAPAVHVVQAGQVHHLVRSGDMEGFVFEFKADALGDARRMADAQSVFNGMARIPTLALSPERIAILADLARMIEAELAEGNGGQVQVLESLLGVVLAKCGRWWSELLPEEEASTAVLSDLVERFRRLVDKHYLELQQVKDYADRLHVTAGHLNDVVRKRLGTTAGTLIDARMQLEAKRLLLHSEMAVKEVGFAIGMNDPAYFARWFKKMEGMGPADFRGKVREQYS
jgi:AraC-like DNA-binding protein/quercetin dioxygenase-like cupin family protein